MITSADFPDDEGRIVPTLRGPLPLRWQLDRLMASSKALYRGQPVAALCATDPHIAEDALELIEVEYELLEPVLDVQEAMLETAPVLHDDLYTEEVAGIAAKGEAHARKASNMAKHVELRLGDVHAGFAEADGGLGRE